MLAFLFSIVVSTHTLSPPPIDLHREFVRVGKERFIVEWRDNKLDIKKVSRLKMYLQDEFASIGSLIVVVFGVLFWLGIWLLTREDYLNAAYVFGLLSLIIMLMVYAFRE